MQVDHHAQRVGIVLTGAQDATGVFCRASLSSSAFNVAPVTSMTSRSGAVRVKILCSTGPDRSNTAGVVRRTPQTHALHIAGSNRSVAISDSTKANNRGANAHPQTHVIHSLRRSGDTPCFAPRGMGRQAQRSAGLMRRNGNVHVGLWQNAGPALRPLDQAQRVALEIIADAEKLQLFGIDRAIQIEMEHRPRPVRRARPA